MAPGKQFNVKVMSVGLVECLGMLKPRYFSSVDTVLRTSVFISCVPKDEHFCIR